MGLFLRDRPCHVRRQGKWESEMGIISGGLVTLNDEVDTPQAEFTP